MTKKEKDNGTGVPVRWEGSIVGWVEYLKVENWFHYGKWVPLDTIETEGFLSAIESEGEAIVLLGDAKGVVHSLPEDGSLEIKIWPGLVA